MSSILGNADSNDGSVFPKLLTLAAVVTFLLLGWWQIERLQWKTAIIEKLQNVKPGSGMPIAEYIVNNAHKKDPLLYQHVNFSGEYDFANEMVLGPRSLNGKAGYHILTPLTLANSNNVIMVNRGWIEQLDYENLASQQIINAEGITRNSGDKNMFTPDNSLEHKALYYIDLPEIAAHLKKLPQYQNKNFPDFYVVYQNPASVGKPVPYNMLNSISNNHLGYAITWFSLAISALLLYMYCFRGSKNSHDRRIKKTR